MLRGISRCSRLSPLALLLVVLTLAPGTALAATKDVSIVDFAFNPSTTKVGLGGTIKWTNDATITSHTSSSNGFADGQLTSGVDLWHSGTMAAGATFSFTFPSAGTFPYHCSIHATMMGAIKVPIRVPGTGTVGTSFRVTWAVTDPGNDFEFNIQKANPGGSFMNWKTGVAHDVMSAKFKPSKTGVYKFRAQLERLSTGLTSGFSPVGSITIS